MGDRFKNRDFHNEKYQPRIMRRNTMHSAKNISRGFTLVASLLLMLLLSGIAISLLMMVNSEQKVGAADLSSNYTYRAAEGAIEKQTSDLANTFKSIQAPTSAQICNVSTNLPTWDPTVTYATYNVAPVNPGVANPCGAPLPPPVWGPIQSGPDAGLYAQIIPITLNASAQRFNGETVSMTRTAEVALIPVFQFGVFCDGDCFFGRSPNLGFAGRVHTNGDLYLGVADGYNLVFGDKIGAFGNVIRQQMDNGVASAGNDNGGTVMLPTTSNGCAAQMANVAGAAPSSTCIDISAGWGSAVGLGATNGSVIGGHGSGQNVASWQNVSLGTYNGYIIDGNGTPPGTTNGPNGTGASDLSLPFVNGTTHPFEIIRRPPPGESTTGLLGGSRLANLAQIRILLSDKEADLHLPGWNGDATQDIQLASMVPNAVFNNVGAYAQNGITVGANTYFFGESACGAGSIGNPCTNGDSNFIWPQFTPGGATSTHNVTKAEWPIVNGWLLVEVKWASDGLWHGATKEWLSLGFARGVQVPTAPGLSGTQQASNSLGTTGYNIITDHKNAILYFQMSADRGGNGVISAGDQITFNSLYAGGSATTPLTPYGLNSQYNWYPINLYDAREGENNDISGFAAGTGTVNGMLNAVELDVGNLKNWLRGLTGSPTGQNVDFSTQNGYVLYFSDRRGMQYDPNAAHNPSGILLGAYGFEDVVNYAAGSPFAPNGTLEPVNYNGVSPEDVEMWNDGAVTKYGVKTVGDAFGTTTANDTDVTNPPNPFAHRINTFTYGRANRITGARHALKLVDGSLGNVPTMPPGNALNNCTQNAANPTGCGGFTVGSENPVYVQGNYNSNCPATIVATPNPCTPGNLNHDATWTNPANPEPNHSAASIIADAVTMLSNNWQDVGATGSSTNGSLLNPTNPGGQGVPAQTPNRIAVTSYYRVAVAGGKTIAFNNTAQNPEFSFGMDGGIHNFLRFLEDWGGVPAAGAQQQLFYKGSLVSLYWNTYATGTFKCCNTVYNPPDRQYTFDPLFTIPSNLPPGTPMFRNVDNLSYRQNQVARSN
jgi:Tfp pilus assembly protein PilX